MEYKEVYLLRVWEMIPDWDVSLQIFDLLREASLVVLHVFRLYQHAVELESSDPVQHQFAQLLVNQTSIINFDDVT